MKHIVISTCDITSFNKQIEDRLAEGWQLNGGVSTALAMEDNERVVYYSQSLIKQKTPVDDPAQSKLL